MTKCIIHIGMHKTGTSSIQQSLNGFADESFVYANLDGHPNHSKALARLFIEDRNERLVFDVREDSQEFNHSTLDRVVAEAGGRTVLFSGEGLSLFSKNALIKLHKFLSTRFDKVCAVAAVRAPGGYMASAVQEPIKRGDLHNLNPARRYRNYKKTFNKFDEIFGSDNVQLWKFDPKKFPGGCAVQDFCRRLGIDFPVERMVRVNESISREALGLLFTYHKFGDVPGTKIKIARINNVLLQRIKLIGKSKFRFSPDVIMPLLEKNRADIEWMESRLGQSLAEDLREHQAGDIREEADLLQTSPETIDELRSMLGQYAPKGVAGQTPEEVALLVHSLRRLSIMERREDRGSPVEKKNEGQRTFGKSSDTRMLSEMSAGVGRYNGLGQFSLKNTQKHDAHKDSSPAQIFFQMDESEQQKGLPVGRKQVFLKEKKTLAGARAMGNCIIHIGMHKTGTSSIQLSLSGFENEQVVYFSGQKKYRNHGGVIFGLVENMGTDRPKGAVRLSKKYSGIAASTKKELEGCILSLKGRDLLISGEGIRFLSVDELMKLRGCFDDMGIPVKIVAYIRTPGSFLTSFAQQQIKGFSENCLELDWRFINYQKSFSKFDTVFGAENIELWKFDPKTLLNGCVVQDFCSRIGVDFPVDRVVRANESLSREALSLLYLYQYYLKFKLYTMPRSELTMLVESVFSQIGNTTFRISPDVLRPILDDNRADIEWMELRLGESLAEEMGEHRESDVRDETDLLSPGAGAVADLRRLLGEHDTIEKKVETPEEIARLVHALREKYPPPRKMRQSAKKNGKIRDTSGDLQISTADLIEAIRHETPGVLTGIPQGTDTILVRSLLQVMANELATLDEGTVKYPGLGHFMVRKSGKIVRGKNKDGNQVIFKRDNSTESPVVSEPDSDSEVKTQEHKKAMKKIHFFVHIPKTAGTSFRKALEKNEAIRMLCDYGEKSVESSRELLAIDPGRLSPDNDIFHRDKHNILCGHVHYQRYAHCITGKDVFAIVRNPVERIISEYQHLKRNYGLLKSFEEYCSSAVQQNKQMKLLQGLEAEGEVLIGLTSHYKYFVELFSDRLSLPIEIIAANKAPVTDSAERLRIDAASIRAAYQYNEKDVAFFFDIARKFAATVRQKGYNTTPAEDTVWYCRIDSARQLVGWFPCDEKDCFFVVLKVNGENRAVVSLDRYRKDIFSKGLSRNPVCGFSYPLSLLGAEQGDTVTVGILDSPIFAKNLIVE